MPSLYGPQNRKRLSGGKLLAEPVLDSVCLFLSDPQSKFQMVNLLLSTF